MRTIKEYRGLRGGSASSRPVKMLAAAGRILSDLPDRYHPGREGCAGMCRAQLPAHSSQSIVIRIQSREETSGRLVKLRERKEEPCLLN